jgi:hypothetical protein
MTKIWNFVGTGWLTALMLVYCVGWWIVGDFTAFWAFLTGFWVSIALNQLMDWHFTRKSSKLRYELDQQLLEIVERYNKQQMQFNFSENNTQENNK